MKSTLALDSREHGLRRRLLTATVGHLPVADIWIGLQTEDSGKLRAAPNGLLIERKAVSDLEASILDGRYREQRSRLLAAATEWQAHPLYIIEGNLDRLGGRLPKSALLKHLTRLSLRYKIQFFQTNDEDDTVTLITLLHSQWTEDPTTFAQPTSLTYVETRGHTREAQSDDPLVFATSVLRCCRGISAQSAQALLEGCGGSLESVMAASEMTLAAVQVGKRKLGPAVAKRLYSLLHTSGVKAQG
jgi:ERCC4-type nuclease